MNKQNIYFRTVCKSTQAIDDAVMGTALRILSFPRTLLEVFIRRDLGERYFSFGNAMMMFSFLAYIPYGYRLEIENLPLLLGFGTTSTNSEVMNILMYQPGSYYEFDLGNFLWRNATWYLFLVAFLYQCIKRQKEIKRLPSVFDFGRSSVDPGKIHPFFENFRWNGRAFNLREIETWLEPLLFFIIALLLILFKQPVGYLILVSSILYWYNYQLAYYQGDHFIMDRIDGILFSEELESAFVLDKNPRDTKGVKYYAKKPSNSNDRRTLADDIEDVDFVEVK
ncbi:hypothetical protein [Emticicia fontis]